METSMIHVWLQNMEAVRTETSKIGICMMLSLIMWVDVIRETQCFFCDWNWIFISYVSGCYFDRASSLICGNKMPTRCNRGFYCRFYCLLNMFRVSPCPSSGAQEYYTVNQHPANRTPNPQLHTRPATWKTTAQNTTRSGHCIILLGSWWWAWWCPKHVEQAIRSAIKTSVASSWHFISTHYVSGFYDQNFKDFFKWRQTS